MPNENREVNNVRAAVVRGSSVKEAVQQTLSIPGTERRNGEVQVLDQDSSRGGSSEKHPEVVKATEKANGAGFGEGLPAPASASAKGPPAEDKAFRPPLAWVKDGNLAVEHPAEGPYPLVIPCPGARLTVNGKEAAGAVPVKKSDTVKIEPVNEFRGGEWALEMSPDEMALTVNIQPHLEIIREIEDLPPAPELELKVRESVRRSAPLSISDLLLELNNRGVLISAVDYEALARAATCSEEKQIVVARGQAPEPGQKARVQILFGPREKVPVVADEKAKADFRDRFTLNSVEAGAVIARKIPPEPGKPGTSVLGMAIAPPPVEDVELVAGKGVQLTADGLTAVAATAGQPRAIPQDKKVILEVLPLLVHSGDVDLSSGNLSFQGSLVIEGNVCEGMSVTASGDVRVRGYVTRAAIRAEGFLVVRGNVHSSTLAAGGKESLSTEILPALQELHHLVTQLTAALVQIQRNPAFARISPDPEIIFRALVGARFKQIPESVKKLKALIQAIPAEMAGEKLLCLAQSAERVLLALRPSAPIAQEISLVREMLEGVIEEYSTPRLRGMVELAYVLNSVIEATGPVKVSGAGCYNTMISTTGPVVVKGVFRGGEIRAGGNVFVGELGSAHGAKSRIVVPAKARITIGGVRGDAEIRIGNRAYQFKEKRDKITAKLDAQGNLSLF